MKKKHYLSAAPRIIIINVNIRYNGHNYHLVERLNLHEFYQKDPASNT